jgi:predicted P-loop ATPase/GTPase
MNSSHKVILFKGENYPAAALVLFAAIDLNTIPGWIGNVSSALPVAGSWVVEQPGQIPVAFQDYMRGNNQGPNIFSPPFEKISPYYISNLAPRATDPNRTATTSETYHLHFYPEKNAFSIDPAPPYQFKIVDGKESFRWEINQGDKLVIDWEGDIGNPWLEFKQRPLDVTVTPEPGSPPVKDTAGITIDSNSDPMRVTLERKSVELTVERRNGVKWSIDFCWPGGRIDPEMQVGTGSGVPNVATAPTTTTG